jgi:DNA-binding NarL/FixJ family response regulator
MRILVAEASHAIFERLSELLASLPGIDITGHTTDVPRTMRCFAERRPDTVILDLNIAGGNGIDVLKSIKRTHPETAVVVLTRFAYPQYRVKCMDLGAHSFLDKSMEFEKVPTLIRELAEKHQTDSGASCDGRGRSSLPPSMSKGPRRIAPCHPQKG